MKKTILIVLAALAGFVVQNGAAEGGGGFADFRKQQQARLWAAIDTTLATEAEQAIGDNFAAVRRVNIDFQSTIGGRKGNIGINLIGSFANSDSHAFGWQLRGYKAQEDSAGANAGLFYRQTNGNALFGGNVFADYEKHEHGDFVRYSIGAEVQNDIVSFAANYYIPITGNKRVNLTLDAFSRQGYDGKLRLNAPNFQALKGAVDYYHFEGEDTTAKDKGFRYGMQWHPTPALQLNLFYDDGGEQFGGDIAYVWTVGEPQNTASSRLPAGAAIPPDLFAPISREHSQRIATVAARVGSIIEQVSIVGIMTTAVTVPEMTTAVTVAAVTTAVTMLPVTTATTIPEMPTVMTTFTDIPDDVVMSVRATTELPRIAFGTYLLVSTRHDSLVTVSPAFIASSPPHALTIMRNMFTESGGRSVCDAPLTACRFLVISASQAGNIGNTSLWDNTHLDQVRPWTITIVQGSQREQARTTTTLTNRTTSTIAPVSMTTVAEPVSTTMTMAAISTTMTIAPVSTTTRITTFVTTTITLGAPSA
ncbi:MAG: inverse autotransporter beta domain-containing protein, partial [Gammaproteobacteria bacterium]